MMRTLIIGLIGFLLFVCPAGLSANQKKSQPPGPDPIEKALASGTDNIQRAGRVPALQRRNPRYQVETGDVMALNFTFTPEFNQTVTVQPDGFVTLRSVGDLHVADKTVPQIRAELEKAYSRILRRPVITVSLQNFQPPYFLALGQVAKPGKYDLRGATTLAQAVAVAGGFTPKAKHSQVLLFRRVNDNWVSVQKVNLKHMLRSGNLREDLLLKPGDMVYVPQNTISKIKPFLPLPSLSFLLGRYPL